jgi:hypothetical protein
MRILGRPADPGGQESFDQLMNQGMTEAMMRETLLRSEEYARKNPDLAARASKASRSLPARKKTKPTRRKKKTKSRRKTG